MVERVDDFSELGSCISPNGMIAEEISARIQKGGFAFAKTPEL